MRSEKLAFASRAFTAGNLAASEVVCRDILDTSPRNAAALNLLGVIATRIKAVDQAAQYFRSAIGIEPQNKVLRRNMDVLASLSRPEIGTEEPRYLVIKAWGFGFWSDISHVLGSLLLAEITGRIPVIHLGKNSLYADETGSDVFRRHFLPASSTSLEDLDRIEGASFFPPKWNRSNLASENVCKWEGPGSRMGALYFLNRPETIAVSDFYVGAIYVQPWIPVCHPMHGRSLDEIHRYLMAKYLRLNSDRLSDCDAFFARHLAGAPFVALHLRGADKVLEDSDVHARQQSCLAALAEIDSTWRIFLMTDDAALAGQVRARYGDRVVLTEAQRAAGILSVHCDPSADRVKAAREVVIDTFLGARADRFIGTGRSNVSTLIAAMKKWRPGHCWIFGDNQINERNLFIFTAGGK